MNETITCNEVLNDGRTVHLYFDGRVGLHVAYGISAFLLSRAVEAAVSYSMDMQMPAAMVDTACRKRLEQRMEVLEDTHGYCCLRSGDSMDEAGYADWAGDLRKQAYGGQGESVNR